MGVATPQDDVAPLDRVDFKEDALPNEPSTDRKLTLEDGTVLRERLIQIDASAENVLTPAENPSPVVLAYAVTNALLEDDGSVALDGEDRPKISSRHEIVFTAEALGRLGTEAAVQEAIDDARAIAAAKARMEFNGMALAEKLLAGRAGA